MFHSPPASAFTLSIVLLLVLSFGMPTEALASSKMDKAKAAFAEARERARTGDLPGSLESILETERYMKHPTVSLLKARVLRRMFKLDRAQMVLDSIDPSKLKRKLRAVLAKEAVQVKTAMESRGHLKVSVSPKTAQIAVLGEMSVGSFDGWLALGQHRVEITCPGFQSAVRLVDIKPVSLRELRVKLRSAMGAIRVTVAGGLRGVELTLDGKKMALDDGVKAGDVATLKASMGAHEVVCSHGTLRESQVLKVETDKIVSISCEGMHPSGVGRAVAGWGGVATGLAMAGYGMWGIATYFSDAGLAEDRLHASSPVLTDTGLVRGGAIETNKHWGGALYLASGLAVSVGSYLFLLRNSAPATAERLRSNSSWQPEAYVASRASSSTSLLERRP